MYAPSKDRINISLAFVLFCFAVTISTVKIHLSVTISFTNIQSMLFLLANSQFHSHTTLNHIHIMEIIWSMNNSWEKNWIIKQKWLLCRFKWCHHVLSCWNKLRHHQPVLMNHFSGQESRVQNYHKIKMCLTPKGWRHK